ncbi:MAG: hypothetical protein QNJ42_13865 [Crocosphaera sp.]|nr:hypothetical protein [Crocosphaera sp.]
MGQRFEELKDVYNTLVAINFDFNQLPATNKYRKFKEWTQDPDLRKRTNAPPASGKKARVGIKAFGLAEGTNDDHTLIKVGSRALGQLQTLGKQSLFGVTDSSVPATYIARPGFVPAKAILGRNNGTGTPTSKITGIEYKRTVSSTYTIPFGKGSTAALAHEFAQQDAILADAAITSDYVVSFTPEKLGRR